ncbi:Glycosyltransferase, GT2 family [Promicromonospora umidemergens]|uniref:glycosyltransferase family 2 protein n=1 Tax=Promicromonospora umidemergens TaxID=629679 RepID=UPI0027E24211|nr:glycosyltransferase family 2 protein [Promicromonospora umidemergens]MCP2282577.1 Glycosyltransferase, GT2 family [Promicromonospora umidemergens]
MPDDGASSRQVSALGDVALIVVNYGSSDLLAANLPRTIGASGVRTVVVDSYSGAGEREAVTRLAARHGWELLTPARNVGFGGGSNLGAAHALAAGSRILLFLNPDAWASPAGLATLASTVRAQDRALVAPRIHRPDGSVYSRGLTYLHRADGTMSGRRAAPDDVPWLSGACLAVAAGLWSELGGFDEEYFLYWEDVDLSWRALTLGARLEVVEDAHVVHDEGGTQESRGRAKSETYYRYDIRNRMLFARKNLGPADVRRWRRTLLPAARAVALRGGRRQLIEGIGPWRGVARGVVEALRVSGERRTS